MSWYSDAVQNAIAKIFYWAPNSAAALMGFGLFVGMFIKIAGSREGFKWSVVKGMTVILYILFVVDRVGLLHSGGVAVDVDFWVSIGMMLLIGVAIVAYFRFHDFNVRGRRIFTFWFFLVLWDIWLVVSIFCNMDDAGLVGLYLLIWNIFIVGMILAFCPDEGGKL